MSKKITWSKLKDLRDMVAQQNVVLLQAIVEVVKNNKEHFDNNETDRKYVFGVLDILNKNTADIKVASDKLNIRLEGIIPGTKKDVVKTKDQVTYLSAIADMQKYGEVLAFTGSELIIEITSRLKVANTDIVKEVVDATENYLEETK